MCMHVPPLFRLSRYKLIASTRWKRATIEDDRGSVFARMDRIWDHRPKVKISWLLKGNGAVRSLLVGGLDKVIRSFGRSGWEKRRVTRLVEVFSCGGVELR